MITERIRAFFRHDGVIRYGSNIAWLGTEKLVVLLVGIPAGIYVARQLGPAMIGELTFVLGLISIFAVLIDWGSSQIIVREMVDNPARQQALLGLSFCLRSLGLLLMAVALTIACLVMKSDPEACKLVLIIGLGYLFQNLLSVDLYFQATVASKYMAVSRMGTILLVSGIKFYLAFKHLPLWTFALMEGISVALPALGGAFFFFRRQQRFVINRETLVLVPEMLAKSWPFLISGLAGMMYLRVDQIFIKSMTGSVEVGYYGTALRLIEFFYVIAMVVCPALLPAVINARNESAEKYRRRLVSLYALMFWLGIMLALPLTLLAGPIITLLYGDAFRGAIPILALYSWNIIFIFLGVARSNWIITENLQRYQLLFAVASCLINMGLNYVCISKMGYVGAAVAALISQFIAVYGAPMLFPRTRVFCRHIHAAIWYPAAVLKQEIIKKINKVEPSC